MKKARGAAGAPGQWICFTGRDAAHTLRCGPSFFDWLAGHSISAPPGRQDLQTPKLDSEHEKKKWSLRTTSLKSVRENLT